MRHMNDGSTQRLVSISVGLRFQHGEAFCRPAQVGADSAIGGRPSGPDIFIGGTGLGALFVEERWSAPRSVRIGRSPGAGGRVALAHHVAF